MSSNQFITVECTVNAPIGKVWEHFTTPASIEQWNNASPDWHCPKAVIDFREGGKFSYIMAAKDESFSFDFHGEFIKIIPHQMFAYKIANIRDVKVSFSADGNSTTVTELFEAENENPLEMQKMGWQAILDNFKQFVENN